MSGSTSTPIASANPPPTTSTICRRRPAVAAVLDHRADDDLRVVRRPVPAPPRLVLDSDVARQSNDLFGGTGLAGDRDRELAEHGIRGAEGEVGALEQPLPDDLER